MSRNTRILISTATATALLLIVLSGIAFAKVPKASVDNTANNTASIQAASVVTPSTDHTPQTLTEFGTYPFTYTIVLHNQDPAVTPTARITVTVDPYLDFDSASGTLLLPGGTLLFPGDSTIVWTPILTYCQPTTLTVTAEGTFDQGTLDLGIDTLTTTVEWNGNRRDMVTRLRLLYKIYLPLVARNF